MEATTTLRLAHDHNNITAVKEASGNIEQGMNVIAGKPADFQVLSGDDTLGVSQVAVGYEGVISVAANAFPQLFSEMIRTAINGNFDEAKKYQYRLLKVMQLHFSEGKRRTVRPGPDVALPRDRAEGQDHHAGQRPGHWRRGLAL